MKQKPFFLVYLFLIGMLSLPMASAATTKTAAGDYLKLLVDGIAGLFRGNTSLFVRNLTAAFPLIAVFLIVLAVVQYVSRKVLFREPENARFASILAVGMALITVWSPGVFGWILGLGITTLVIIFIFILLAFVYEGIASHQTGLTNISNANTGLSSSRKALYEAQKEESKEEHLLTMERALETKETADLKEAREALKKMRLSSTDIDKSLNAVLRILKRIVGVRNEAELLSMKESLSRELGVLNSRLTVPRTELTQLFQDLNEFRKIGIAESKEAAFEKNVVMHIENRLRAAGKFTNPRVTKLKNKFISELKRINSAKIQLANEATKIESQLATEQQNLILEIQRSINALHNFPKDVTAETAINQALNINKAIEGICNSATVLLSKIQGEIYNQNRLLNEIENEIQRI